MCRKTDTMRPNRFVKNMLASQKFPCKFDCGQNIEGSYIEEHYKSKCLKRICQCRFCEKEMAGDVFTEHLTSMHLTELMALNDLK